MQGDNLSECYVIGCLLQEADALADVEQIITIADFESEVCKEAYQSILDFRDAGKPLDWILLRAELNKKLGVDCTVFLTGCLDVATTVANLDAHCKAVKDAANDRRAARLSRDISEAAYNGADASEIADIAQSKIDEIRANTTGDVSDSKSMVSRFRQYYQKVKENPDFAYCRTMYHDLDRKFGGGMFRGGMYIIGARPGMGKTTLGINIAENIATAKRQVLFVSLEMTEEQIVAKRMSCNAGIPYTMLMGGTLSALAEKEMDTAAGVLAERPFNLAVKSCMTVVDIGKAARKIKDLSVIVVDYLGLVGVPDEQQQKSRYEQMTNISANIKALAKLLNIPIVVLCQLNRESTKSADKRPQLVDLRDSGAIEQDADAVVLLHRPEYYSEDAKKPDYKPPEHEEIELIVAKNRHAGTGTVLMQWSGNTGEIDEVDRVHNDI